MPDLGRLARNLIITSFVFLIGFAFSTLNAPNVNAQSCSCTVSVSQGECGTDIDPDTGLPIATCENDRVTKTVSGTVIGSRCEYFTLSSSCSINSNGDCVLDSGSQPGSCTYRPPSTSPPGPSSPPVSGDECWDNGGVCMTGSNCGEFGLADTSYTCSDGQPLCCVPVSGGGGGGGGGGTDCGEWSCDMQWRVPSLMYVGLTYPTVAFPNWDDDAHDQSFYKMTFDTENYFVT